MLVTAPEAKLVLDKGVSSMASLLVTKRDRGRRKGFRPRWDVHLCRLFIEPLEQRCLLSSDPILDWNAVALEVNRISYSGGVVNDEIGPTRSSRALAIEHVAMFDAWNSIHYEYTPYLVKAPHSFFASDVAAVAQAAHDTLVAMYPHQQAYIDTALDDALRSVPDGLYKTRGINVGIYVAQAILAARTNDGSEVEGSYVPDGLPGHHVADPLNPDQGFLTPAWGNVKTFGITSTDQVPTIPVPDMTSDEYTDAFNQVYQLGAEDGYSTRTTDQTEIGIYWGYDVARGLGDPPRIYNQIARVVAQEQRNTVGENARMFALINIAMADAGIQCWGVKYQDIFWRPIVGIRRADEDGNPNTIQDPNWVPLGAPKSNPLPGEINFTPPFRSYTSGHATFGGAAFKMMADFYQTDDVNFSIPFDFMSDEFNGVTTDIHKEIPDLILNYVRQIRPRHYDSFSQAAAENAASRIFLGIHWRFDAINGIDAGDRIGDIDFDTILRPKNGGGPLHVPTVDFVSQIDAYLNNMYLIVFPGSGPSGVVVPATPVGADLLSAIASGSPEYSLNQTSEHLAVANDIPTLAPAGVGSADPTLDQAIAAAAGSFQLNSAGQSAQSLDASLPAGLSGVRDEGLDPNLSAI
jgi:hypothetical protein